MESEAAVVGQVQVLLAGTSEEMGSRLREIASGIQDIEFLGPMRSTSEIADAVASTKPRVVLLDLTVCGSLVECAGLIADIRVKSPESRVLVCSAVTVNGIVQYLLHLGISGYVFEHMHPQALLVAIRTVASGGNVFSEVILRR